MASDAGPSTENEPGLYRLSTTTSRASHADTDPRSPEKSPEDADTCRICRGEGTPEEPLFYPCKCSGSIKFVHQECLMEWLSHSQKKYCELCKTSFRFTKLYHPTMPKTIPTSIFVRRAAVHVLRMFMTWCRALLVASVWLIFLPWCMRVVWRSLFWVGDGGWARDLHTETEEAAFQPSITSAWDLDTVRSAIESAKSANSSVARSFPNFLLPFSQTLNMSAGEPAAWTILKRFFFGVPFPRADVTPPTNGTSSASNTTSVGLGNRNPSLLSGMAFFNWFPSQTANRFLIDVLEGQVITLLVVVAFILIFLIREWVVQQQPVMNMVALNAADRQRGAEDMEELGEEDEQVDDHQGLRVFPNEQVHRAEPAPNGHAAEPDANEGAQDHPDSDNETSTAARDARRFMFQVLAEGDDIPEDIRRAMQDGSTQDITGIIKQMPPDEAIELKKAMLSLAAPFYSAQAPAKEEEENSEEESNNHADDAEPVAGPSRSSPFPQRTSSLPEELSIFDPQPSSQRPNMPARDRSFLATDVRRNLEETNSWSFDGVPKDTQDDALQRYKEEIPEAWDDEVVAEGSVEKDPLGSLSDPEQDSEHSSESWQQVPEVIIEDEADATGDFGDSKDKGKGKALYHDTEGSAAQVDAEAEGPHREATSASSEEASIEPSTSFSAEALTDPSARSEESETEHNLRAEDVTIAPEQIAEQAYPDPEVPQRLIDHALDWLFGDVAPLVRPAEEDGNDEHVVEDINNEPPFVPFAANEPEEPANPRIQDPEVAAAAAQAGIDLNDQDAIDEAEDLEGIMELIGMQGPILGLFQNALFSAVLISATLACAVWLPYLWGKVVLLLMGSPVSIFIKLPLQFIASFADFIVDTALCLGGGAVFWLSQFVRMAIRLCTWGSLYALLDKPASIISISARSIAENAIDRLGKLAVTSILVPRPDFFHLSINSHAALRTIQNATSSALNQTSNAITSFCENIQAESASHTAFQFLSEATSTVWESLTSATATLASAGAWILNSTSYKITFDLDVGTEASATSTAVDHWTATDRLIAIFAGYAFFAIAGAFYLKRNTPFSSSQQGHKIEGIIADVLQQAGGVLKVILIISIEMLVFPLYCGLLLDIALLPLFGSATLYTRWQFTRSSPWTSCFVHWFIGTCYMFHFALFVSMCRRIMRKGVLYFIRDPDDPTFHPVRDVLERSVTTQLRKIAFSALVYGALVIVCLGGVVWGLSRATTGILPIQWASRAPSLEFPLDLLFYNFLTPLIIKFVKPNDPLQAVYGWWFKICAHRLRLSHFLFGERVKEEEGHHVRRSWSSWLRGEKGNANKPVIGEDRKILAEDRGTRVYFMADGKYVRAPASDQVRIPKGDKVFVEVDRNNKRKDNKDDQGGVHNDLDLVTTVYIPPWFRVRIALFVLTIWIFAAMTGVGVTVGPLLFGRYLFSLLLPSDVEMNDIHAYSLGAYTLGTLAYGIYHLYKLTSTIPTTSNSSISTLWTVTKSVSKFTYRVVRFLYVWTSLVFVIPFLIALLLELYFLMPLHAYFGPQGPHVIHLIQDWTLGFLYARLAARVIMGNRNSRAGLAFRAVIANGYLNPNARLATRCFLLPVVAVFTIAVAAPASLAFAGNRTFWASADGQTQSQVWRFSFPFLGAAILSAWVGKETVRLMNRWRMVVRDEVYLIGERLHNFGEKRPPAPAPAKQVRPAGRT